MKIEEKPVLISINGKEEEMYVAHPRNYIIKQHREALGYTQQQIANMCDMTVRQYQRYESGEKSIYSASFNFGMKMCHYLQIDLDDLFYFDDKQK